MHGTLHLSVAELLAKDMQYQFDMACPVEIWNCF